MPIKFKQGVAGAKKKNLSSTFEDKVDKAKPQNINDIFETLNLMLKNIGVPLETFYQFVANTK
ncbi:MAG: hypothetical protein ACI9Y1_003240 [Lentisphaeria bacterium]|jgi:hypothetical protein